MTTLDFGVNCGALGVGERVGEGVNVNVGGSASVKVLVGKLPAFVGVGTGDAKRGKLQAIINSAHKSKSITR